MRKSIQSSLSNDDAVSVDTIKETGGFSKARQTPEPDTPPIEPTARPRRKSRLREALFEGLVEGILESLLGS